MHVSRRRLAWTLIVVMAAIGAGFGVAHAQRIWAGGYGRMPPRFPTATTFDGAFHFCRVMFTSDRREKQGWSTDYPGADLNFSVRLAELTKVRVTMAREGGEPFPDAVVVRLTDDALFQCPFIFMEDAGTARFSEVETGRLRARQQFDEEMRKVLPPGQSQPVDLNPPGHPMWNTMFPVTRLPQMASIMTWRRSGGGTIERWNDEAAPPDARGIADTKGRVMVLMVHNTDLPDPWEREGEDKEYFFRFSPEAYAVGIDILLYAMTH
jgi:hypothetical protein